MNFEVINVIAELERLGAKFTVAGDSVRTLCPFHEDTSPSCMISQQKRVFSCMSAGCGQRGGILKFLAKALNSSVGIVTAELAERYPGLLDEKFIDPQVIEEYHAQLPSCEQLVQQLRARGVTDEIVRRHRIGAHRGRVTIPIKNPAGMYVNVRFYLPGAPADQKMKNLRGFGKPDRLFPAEQIKHDSVVICGGELKAAVAAELLNSHGIGAISSTGSESRWSQSFSPLLAGKRVWVLFDVDKAGIDGAERVCFSVKPHARWLGKVMLPLDTARYPKGDVNDWVGQEGATSDDLVKLLKSTPEWEPPAASRAKLNGQATSTTLQFATKAEMTGSRIITQGVVAAIGELPYVIPKTVRAKCDRSQGDTCQQCVVFTHRDQHPELTIHPESPHLMEMVNAGVKTQRAAVMRGVGVATACKIVDFDTLQYYNVDEVRLTPRLELSDRSGDRMMQAALCVDAAVELNETYEMTGRMWPHPKNQQATLLMSETRAMKNALDADYSASEDLSVFQTSDPQAKLDEIYADFEDNVTGIRMRRDMHLCMDLAWHSALLYRDSATGRIEKGWVEVLVLGDSSQGKSEMARQLMRHYRCGEKMECKNATVAGLLGGLQKFGDRWLVTWGAIPTHDRRLVVLEELKGAPIEVICRLTDMRSSGVAEIPKIERRRTHARTRLVAISNPRSSQPLSSYSFGVNAIKELIGGLEDVRRFDVVCMVAAGEIDHRKIHARGSSPHTFTSDKCHDLVMWAWTRRADQIVIGEAATSEIARAADALCVKFVEDIPIVDQGSTRHKLSRLAVALACRLFSTSDGQIVEVLPVHVKHVAALLDRMYSSKTCGYEDFSKAIRGSTTLLDDHLIRARIASTPFPKDLIEQLMSTDEIEMQDFQDWCGWERGNAQQLLSFLVRKHALHRDARCYRKSAAFIDLLKGMRSLSLDRPDYVDEKDPF